MSKLFEARRKQYINNMYEDNVQSYFTLTFDKFLNGTITKEEASENISNHNLSTGQCGVLEDMCYALTKMTSEPNTHIDIQNKRCYVKNMKRNKYPSCLVVFQ